MPNDEFALDVVQAAELKFAFGRNGWTNADVKKFCGGDMAARLLPVVRGNAEITVLKYHIDLDSAPFVPDGWEVKDGDHQKGGQFEWNVTKVNLFLSKNQQGSKTIQGHKLRKELESKKPFNANLLDFLFANQKLIPEEWKGKYVYFWGTVYRYSDGDLYVRCLYWRGGYWRWHWYYLDDDWSSSRPAAVPAS